MKSKKGGFEESIDGSYETSFTSDEIKYMKKLIHSKQLIPPSTISTEGKPLKEHVEHCFCQLLRFANEAKNGGEFRMAQFCLNLGRVQEILKSVGGVKCWWRVFEPLINNKDYDTIIQVAEEYLTILDLPIPSKDKMNNKCA